MKKIIYFIVLVLILQGCNGLQPKAENFSPYNTAKEIVKGKVYELPIGSNYVLIDPEFKKLFSDTKNFSQCSIGDVFWSSPNFMKTEVVTSEYLAVAEEEELAGCTKSLSRVY